MITRIICLKPLIISLLLLVVVTLNTAKVCCVKIDEKKLNVEEEVNQHLPQKHIELGLLRSV